MGNVMNIQFYKRIFIAAITLNVALCIKAEAFWKYSECIQKCLKEDCQAIPNRKEECLQNCPRTLMQNRYEELVKKCGSQEETQSQLPKNLSSAKSSKEP